MKQILIAVFLLFSTGVVYSQQDINDKNDSIVQEGKTLYLTEMASWYGTDIFLDAIKDQSKIGGYFSYPTNNAATCIFFSREEKPKVIGTITFDSTFSIHTANADLTERDFLPQEHTLYQMRSTAFEVINNDTFFITYKNTGINIIPIIYKGEKKVYVLTGPKKNGVVIFGNDYLLTLDNNMNVLTKKRLHKNIISIDYTQKNEDGNKIVGAMHSHLPETGDCMTVTDICTLMLYQKFAGWETHTVVSENYFSFWNCQSNTLVSITKEALDKINSHQKTKDKE